MVDVVTTNPVTVLFRDTVTGLPVIVTASNPLPVTSSGGGVSSNIAQVGGVNVASTGVASGALGKNTVPLPAASNPFTRVMVNITTATTTTVVSLTAAQTVRVYRMMLNFAAAQTLNINSSTAGTLVGAPMTFGAGGGLVWDFDGVPWVTTTAGEGLTFVTTTTGAITGFVDYIKS